MEFVRVEMTVHYFGSCASHFLTLKHSPDMCGLCENANTALIGLFRSALKKASLITPKERKDCL